MIMTSQRQLLDTIEVLRRQINRLEEKNWNLKQEVKRYEENKKQGKRGG